MAAIQGTSKWSIVIIGAGIGGLATAISLAQKTSHSIRILERSTELREAGAGIQITPNASRILCYWGLKDEFEKIATVPDFMDIRRYADNETIGLVPTNMHDYASRVWGHPHWLVHRVDYQQTLARAAKFLGVTIDFNVKVTYIDTDTLTIHTEPFQPFQADLVIGADGINSRTRQSIASLSHVTPIRALNYCYRTLIPAHLMHVHPLTTAILNNPNQISWAGHTRHIIGYPISRGGFYNLVLVIPDPSSTAPIAGYNEAAPPDEMRASSSLGWHDAVTTMLSLAPDCTKWTLADLPSLPTWRSANGRVVLLGDAAHAMTPHAASGAAMTIEDAEILGACIAECTAVSDIPTATAAYEEIRKDRCERVQRIARDNAASFSLADGPEQQGRDAKLAEAKARLMTEMDRVASGEGEFRRPEKDVNARFPSPGVVMWLYGYDAVEEGKAYLAGQRWTRNVDRVD